MTWSRLLIPLVLFASGAGVSQAQPAPANQAGPTRVRFASHPYTSALDAITNYQSCGANVRTAAAFAQVDRAFRASEAVARAKGLGALLDELRRDYQALLAVSTRIACFRGPAAALTGARTSVRAFQAWVAAQPPADGAGTSR